MEVSAIFADYIEAISVTAEIRPNGVRATNWNCAERKQQKAECHAIAGNRSAMVSAG
ncbi:MAG: hypothetical protein ACXW0T_12675 [Methylobacter sp.]